MWDGRNFHGAKIALVLNDRTIIYKRDNIPTIPFPGRWDLPGGGREGNESPLDCAIREVNEEFGLIITPAMIRFCRNYSDHQTPDKCSYFLVAEINKEQLADIRFGSEGERWELVPIADFLADSDAVPHLQMRMRDWLGSFRGRHSEATES